MVTSTISRETYDLQEPAAESFVIPFKYIYGADIRARLNMGDGFYELAYGTDYDVSEPLDEGGTLNRLDEWPEGAIQLIVWRETPVTQEVVILNGGRIDGPLLERMMDKLTLQNQEMIRQSPETPTELTPSDTYPLMDGQPSPGDPEDPTYSRGTHRHSSDTGRAPASHAASDGRHGLATSALYGHAKASSAIPLRSEFQGGAGLDNGAFAREGHWHPSLVPTPDPDDNSLYAANTTWVQDWVQTWVPDWVQDWVQDWIKKGGGIPVDTYYTQYPATDASGNPVASGDVTVEFPAAQTPAALFGGTWVACFENESIFFRSGGKNNLSTGGRSNGKQGDAIRNLTGLIGSVVA
jgi:hypothetical protein